jgi:hypothetical protein
MHTNPTTFTTVPCTAPHDLLLVRYKTPTTQIHWRKSKNDKLQCSKTTTPFGTIATAGGKVLRRDGKKLLSAATSRAPCRSPWDCRGIVRAVFFRKSQGRQKRDTTAAAGLLLQPTNYITDLPPHSLPLFILWDYWHGERINEGIL